MSQIEDIYKDILNAYTHGSFIISAHGCTTGKSFVLPEGFHVITTSPLDICLVN